MRGARARGDEGVAPTRPDGRGPIVGPRIPPARRRGDGCGSARGRDRRESLADLAEARPGDLLDDLSVLEEHQVGPELHPERPAEGPARPVLDLDVPDLG